MEGFNGHDNRSDDDLEDGHRTQNFFSMAPPGGQAGGYNPYTAAPAASGSRAFNPYPTAPPEAGCGGFNTYTAAPTGLASGAYNPFPYAPPGSGSGGYHPYTTVPNPYSASTPSRLGMSGLNLNSSSGYPPINEFDGILRSGDPHGSSGAPPVGAPAGNVDVDTGALPRQRRRPSVARGGRRGRANNDPADPVLLPLH
jgi:hypothetical protein